MRTERLFGDAKLFEIALHQSAGQLLIASGALSLRKYTAVFLFLLCAFSVRAQNFISGQAARAEFGQYTFTPGVVPTLPNQQILGGASGLAWANGTLYVADSNVVGVNPQDNRVVMFNTGLIPAPNADLTYAKTYSPYQCKLCAFPAFNQLGQPGFTATAADSTGNSFNPGRNNDPTLSNERAPTAVATDGTVVAVADTNNNRVLIWSSIPTSINQAANVVLGQADFIHALVTSPPTASSLRGPQGVWIQNGKLYVADTQDYRVLIWNSIPTSNNQPADVVLGQPNFNIGTQAACDPTKTSSNIAAANELCNPVSVTSDGSHVFVADLGFNRVLIWNSIPGSNGQKADVVIGQPDMVSTMSNNPVVCLHTGSQVQCANNLNFPRFALSDGTRLFLADGGNDRVLIFNTIPTQNGAAADEVLGQPNFGVDIVSSGAGGRASTTVDSTSAVNVTPTPTSLAFDGLNLYVADPLDNRVLVFTPGNTPLPGNSVVNWASELIRQEGILGINVIAGSATANNTVTLNLAGKAYTFTTPSGATATTADQALALADTIARGLVAQVNGGNGDPNVIAIFAGVGSGTLYLSSRGVDLGFDTIAFTASSSNTASVIVSTSGNGYLTAGTAATAAPGMLVEINGNNLSDISPSNPAVAALTGLIPTSLGGAQVFLDGVASPVYSADSSQVVSQIPFNFNNRNSTSVYVRTTHSDGSVTVTNATPGYIAQANPGLFDAPSTPGQPRPWPATGAYHQLNNPQAVVDLTGTVNAGDVLTIKISNQNSYSYTVQSGDSLASITQNLANAVNNGNDPNVTAQVGAAFNRVVIVARQSGAAGNGIAVSTSTGSNAKITLTAYTNATCCNVVNGSKITAANPAAPGETISLSAAGLGVVTNLSGTPLPDIPTGLPYTLDAVNSAGASVSATMGSSTAQVVSAGLPQGSYGIYQVQLIVPPNQPTNPITPVNIAQNAFLSNTVTLPVGPANSNPFAPPLGSSSITITIDQPNSQSAAVTGSTLVAGWVTDKNTTISSVQVSVDGIAVGAAIYGNARPDVCAILGALPGCPNVGFTYALNTTQFADGPHTLQITATAASGVRLTNAGSFKTSNFSGSNPTLVNLDNPGGQGGTFQGIATFYGWALNTSSIISSVTVAVDGVGRGSAAYGASRPDVCAVYASSPGCSGGTANVGWSYVIDTTGLANGRHVFSVSATATNGQHTIQAHSFTVANWLTSNPIIANIDKPTSQSAPLTGVQNIGGWAVDPYSTIASVSVAVDGVPLGNAGYGANRSDVCAVYSGSPGCPNVGWNFGLDTTLIPDGTHSLEVTYTPSSGQGFTQTTPFQVANLGSMTNSTLISIDKPNAQSAPFSGVAFFGGWAVNSNAAIATVEISIDGNPNGYAAYGGQRLDVCAKLPGSLGCPNVGWNDLLDTLTLTNGAHSVEVTATTVTGQRATSSSSFSVLNSTSSSPTSVSIAQPSGQSSPFQGMAFFSGTALGTSAPISSIFVTVDGYPYGSASYTAAGVNLPVNWTYSLNTAQFADGPHTFGVTATAADGTFAVSSASFLVANWTSPSPTRISIDTPNTTSPSFSGLAAFGGWAINPKSAIAGVSVAIDGVPYGSAQYGGNRPDVCAVYTGQPGCPDVGWNFVVDSTLLANGMHTLAVTATTAASQSFTISSSFTVAN